MSGKKKGAPFRVLQLGPWPPPHGGVQTNLVAIHNSLQSHGNESRVINIANARNETVPNVYFPQGALALIRLLATVPADIVHLHVGDLRRALIGLAVLITALPGKRSVLSFHSGRYAESDQVELEPRQPILAATLRRFDGIICVNKGLLNFLGRQGVAPQRLHLIAPNPSLRDIKLPALQPDLAAFVSRQCPLIIAVGLLEPEYNVPFLFDAVAALQIQMPGAGLVVIGSGALNAELRHRLSSHPARDFILMTGDLPREMTLAVISSSTVMLRATSWDGDSVSVREAVELKVPVVATYASLRPAEVRCFTLGDLDGCVSQLVAAIQHGPQIPAADLTSEPPGRRADDNIERILNVYRNILSGSAT